MSFLRFLLPGFVALMPFAAQAQPASIQPGPGLRELYTSRAIVTGAGPAARPEALGRCLRDVLVKVSGDPALRDDPRVAPLAGAAAGYLDDLVYLDRLTDIPHHDEQGSRDRPYDLVAHFDPARIDAALAGLGETPFVAGRPALLVLVTVSRNGATVPLSADGDATERLRRGLLDAARLYGLEVVLLPADRLVDDAGRALDPGRVAASGPARLDGRLTARLTGALRWSDAALGWVGTWRLSWRGEEHGWGVAGVSFDAAFRDAMGGALRILSGHGAPR